MKSITTDKYARDEIEFQLDVVGGTKNRPNEQLGVPLNTFNTLLLY